MPGARGAYALLVLLDRPVELPSRFDGQRLPGGRYCYVGSARGAGGIRGRCARHLRAPLRCHWHIDWLLAGALDRAVVPFPGQQECEVLARLLAIEGASVPVPGFGSTDCRRCPSHLLALDPASLAALPDRLIAGERSVGSAHTGTLPRPTAPKLSSMAGRVGELAGVRVCPSGESSSLDGRRRSTGGDLRWRC
jgi:Uri superfamily endonuclease